MAFLLCIAWATAPEGCQWPFLFFAAGQPVAVLGLAHNQAFGGGATPLPATRKRGLEATSGWLQRALNPSSSSVQGSIPCQSSTICGSLAQRNKSVRLLTGGSGVRIPHELPRWGCTDHVVRPAGCRPAAFALWGFDSLRPHQVDDP